MYELTVEAEFSAAHQILGYPGPCARLHGHNYRVVATVRGEHLDELGLLVDFGVLRQLLAGLTAELDHRCLNELPPLQGRNPTSELLAHYFYHALERRLRDEVPADLSVAAVTVYESARSAATYRQP